MTEKDNHNLSDEELEAYLKGKHEVSEAYRALEKVSTPEDLDARILARARESVNDNRKDRGDIDVYKRSYAVAATVFLCFTITLILVNDRPSREPELMDTGNFNQPQSAPVTLEQVTPASPPQLAPAAETGNAAFDAVSDESNASTVAEASTSNQLRSGAASLRAEADAVAAPAIAGADTPERREESQALEEIVVTGATLQEPAYRNEREAWLEEIRQLRETGQDDQAELEAELFLEAYPGTDIEAEISEPGLP